MSERNNSAVVMSDDVGEQQEVILLEGRIGVGKTFAALSASKHWTGSLPLEEETVFDDMFWIQLDAKATAGFRHNKVKVPTFDVSRFMQREDVWKEAGLRKAPTIIQAIEQALRAADAYCKEKGGGVKIVVDTLSKLDYKMLLYHMELADRIAPDNTYKKFDLNLRAHNKLHETLRTLDASQIIYCCHVREMNTSPGKDQATVVGTAKWGPDLTGSAPKFYKSDESMQIVVKTTTTPKGEVKRQLCMEDPAYETKNRYQGLVPSTTDVDLGRIFRAIERGEWE